MRRARPSLGPLSDIKWTGWMGDAPEAGRVLQRRIGQAKAEGSRVEAVWIVALPLNNQGSSVTKRRGDEDPRKRNPKFREAIAMCMQEAT